MEKFMFQESGTSDYSDRDIMAVVDVVSEQYKVNYKVDLPAYSQM